MAGIIHKASQGFNCDNKYSARSQTAKSKGLLYASYHLGTKADPIKQADFYLETIKDNLDQPMALDIEEIGGNNISLKNATKFIERIFEKTHKYPFIYVNNAVFNEINKHYDKTSVFAKCPLWYARFISKLPTLSTKVWDKVTIWQFSCEINCCECDYNTAKKQCKTLANGNIKYSREFTPLSSSGQKSTKTGFSCPYKIAGTSCDMDINAFNGDKNTLIQLWDTYK
ncbi:MAG: glycoside hydrolase family 25 protein [Flavobacterium sp.]